MVLYGFRERAEDDSEFLQLRLIGCCHRYTVENRIDSNTREDCPFLQWNAKLLICFQELRIDFVEALGSILVLLRCRVIADLLIVDPNNG